ncbi:MAG TPA: winged helix-turn-helix domain-containing protein [Methanocorpusculum sp.]|nr:winged helix-turn-helix domain-containing protein [Methanocorpusculum sp.]
MQRTILPNSCINILQLLEGAHSLTHKDIVEKSGLAPRTVRYALRRLKEAGLIIEKFNFHDARQSYFQLKTPQNTMAAV